MTAPALPAAVTAAPAPPLGASPPVVVPFAWLLEQGSVAVQVRTLLDLAPAAGLASAVDAGDLRLAVLGHAPALRLALAGDRDGHWPGGLLAVPSVDEPALERAATIPAVRRLLEYGWPCDAPPLVGCRRVLFRLLAEDADAGVLAELRDEAPDEARVRIARRRLRDAAGATLAQLGCEMDPRLRGLAGRTLDRTMAWLRSGAPERIQGSPAEGDEAASAGRNDVLPEDATPPSAHLLAMLAWMPRFRSERFGDLTKLLAFVAGVAPTRTPRQRAGPTIVSRPDLVLGDPLPDTIEARRAGLLPALAWLELLARLGALRRNERWSALLDTLLAERDAEGRWPHRVQLPAADPFLWPLAPLGDPTDGRARQVDVTFRLALVARLAGRTLVAG